MKFAPFLASLLLAGCTLIDQRTFAPSPEAEPIPVVSGALVRYDARTPLVTIDFASPSPNYRDLLRLAARAAEARDSAVQFDVVAITQSLQSAAPPQAIEVMRTMMAERVAAARLHLGMRSDATVSAVQVRVYVR